MTRLIRVRGLVQGVGFRPYVWRLATALGLSGWVRNDGEGVSILVNGPRADDFLRRLPAELPPLARIDGLEIAAGAPPQTTESGFTILDSAGGAVTTLIGPDAATCPECIAEMCDPNGRRWRHPFITCTHCGPRFTVSRGLPYDRARTTLASFPLCAACDAEYRSPANRRFHAETTCCPACGPQLALVDAEGQPLPGDPVAQALRLLQAGRVVAIKGLGGFHLACDARQPAAVAMLRQRKSREAKPFAVMGQNPGSLASWVAWDDQARRLFDSAAAPIVLCRKAGAELAGVAPGLATLGVMRPATPLHLLLWHEAAGRPPGTDWLVAESPLLLVMTSANPQGEPLVADNAEALRRLSGIADAFLWHDRDIAIRCDDSVVQPRPEGHSFVRRARGHVPTPIPLADDGPTVLALGGYLKNTICVARGREALLSQHIGSLDNVATVGFLEETVTRMLDLLAVRPDVIAHDLHPDFPSTHLARRLAAGWGIETVAVGHHHAHVAAVCAEHGVETPVLGIAIDGVGLGSDGAAWGGEWLRVDGGDCQRLAHVAPLHMPGGERAAREPWRLAVAALHDTGRHDEIGPWLDRCFPGRDAAPLLAMLRQNLRCPATTSLGRWFDVAAALLGVCGESRYEAEAAMLLEGAAAAFGKDDALPWSKAWRIVEPPAATVGAPWRLDLSPMLGKLLAARDPQEGAARFHATLAAAMAECSLMLARSHGLETVAIGGGCALNRILMKRLRGLLEAGGLEVLEARQAPPGDGGLALGQAWVARRMMKERRDVSGRAGTSR